MKVYVLLKDDGNVCCPAYEIVSMHTTQELAETRMVLLSQGQTYPEDFWVEEHDVDEA